MQETHTERRDRINFRIATLTQYPQHAKPGELDALAEELMRLGRVSKCGESASKRGPYLRSRADKYSVLSVRRMEEETVKHQSLNLRGNRVSALDSEDFPARSTRRGRYIKACIREDREGSHLFECAE